MFSETLRATGVPAFVKNASVDEDSCPDFSTSVSTFLTYALSLTKAASADEQRDCWNHVKFWNIEKDCRDFQAKFAKLQQPWLLADNAFCLLKKEASVRKYAAYDADSTYTAAKSFYENRASYPFAWRNEAAQNLLAKAASYGVTLPEYVDQYLHKAACFGAADPDCLAEAIAIREDVTTAEFSEEMNKVATVLDEMRQHSELRTNMSFLKEAMTLIDTFDQMSNPTVPLIEEVISNGMTLPELQKVAADDSYTVKLINGREVDVRTIKKAALQVIDPNLASMEAGELASVLPTLPRPDADLLTRLMA